jgi:hypothetical protein
LFGNALAVQRNQSCAIDRRAFGEANLIKTHALHAMQTADSRSLQQAEMRFKESLPVLTTTHLSPFPLANARLALALARQQLGLPVGENVPALADSLVAQGRWRDRILLEGLLDQLPVLNPQLHSTIQQLDKLASRLPASPALIDSALRTLPLSLADIALEDRKNPPLVLFCV